MDKFCLRVLVVWLLAFVPADDGTQIPVTISSILLGSTTVLKQITETPQRIKFAFSISYETIRRDINTKFLEDLQYGLARILTVSSDRISDIEVTPGPKERAVVDFKLLTGGTVYSTIKVALDGFNKGDVSKQELSAGGFILTPLIMYCNWTDGQCPKDNDCIENCGEKPNSPNLYPLFVLLLIPVIIVVAIVLLWYFKYRKVGEKSRIDLTELGYVENRSKFGGTLANRKGTISGISLADNGVRNEVYTVMGQKYGFSIDNADFSDDSKVYDD